MQNTQDLKESRLANAWAELQQHALEGHPLPADAYRLAFADPEFPAPAFSMYENRKHRWVDILGDDVERH